MPLNSLCSILNCFQEGVAAEFAYLVRQVQERRSLPKQSLPSVVFLSFLLRVLNSSVATSVRVRQMSEQHFRMPGKPRLPQRAELSSARAAGVQQGWASRGGPRRGRGNAGDWRGDGDGGGSV